MPMPFTIDEQRLTQLAQFINEMPTKFGFPLAVLLNNWKDEPENPAPVPAPADANSDSPES